MVRVDRLGAEGVVPVVQGRLVTTHYWLILQVQFYFGRGAIDVQVVCFGLFDVLLGATRGLVEVGLALLFGSVLNPDCFVLLVFDHWELGQVVFANLDVPCFCLGRDCLHWCPALIVCFSSSIECSQTFREVLLILCHLVLI